MIWYVAVGGALGSVSRYALGTFFQHKFGMGFPIGTLVINVTGSFLLGLFIRMAMTSAGVSGSLVSEIPLEVRVMLTTGFCGGYTTFSTFSYETASMLQDGHYTKATLYVLASVALSLMAVFFGYSLARYST